MKQREHLLFETLLFVIDVGLNTTARRLTKLVKKQYNNHKAYCLLQQYVQAHKQREEKGCPISLIVSLLVVFF